MNTPIRVRRRPAGAAFVALASAFALATMALFPAYAYASAHDHGVSVDTDHACRHFDDEAQPHTATATAGEAPVLQGTHRLFDVAIPSSGAGYVRYSVPEARTYAFFTASSVQLTLSYSSGATVTPAGNSTSIEGCPAIAAWVAYEFAAPGTYSLYFQGVTSGEVLLLVEEASGHGHGHGHGHDDDYGHDDDDDHGHGHDDDHGHEHDDDHGHDDDHDDKHGHGATGTAPAAPSVGNAGLVATKNASVNTTTWLAIVFGTALAVAGGAATVVQRTRARN